MPTMMLPGIVAWPTTTGFRQMRRRFGTRRRSYQSSSSDQEVRQKSYRVVANKRTNLIFGANTNVGKSVISTGLVRASLQSGRASHYIKPLQCGGSDQAFVEQHVHASSSKKLLTCHTLFRWETPASPHTASRLENVPVSDEQVLTALHATLVDISHNNGIDNDTATYIETAGGVLSPSSASPDNQGPHHAGRTNNGWGWTTQADLYQPILGYAPVILIGDGRLGGISATICALESLVLRGYDVAALVLLETNDLSANTVALREYVAHRAFAVRSGTGEALLRDNPQLSIVGLPPVPADPTVSLHDWYASAAVVDTLAHLDDYLQQSWQGQVSDLRGMAQAGMDVLWYPFTQHGTMGDDTRSSPITVVDSAHGDYYHILQNVDKSQSSNSALAAKQLYDASASWWTQGVGHGASSLALASAAAAGRYGHVLFPGTVHAPALHLAQTLVSQHDWAARVFYSDNGSTALEVALKMGLQTYRRRMRITLDGDIELVVCGQEGCYHGDTLGAMNVAEPSIFNDDQHPWYQSKGLFLAPPTIGYRDGELCIEFPEGAEPSEDTKTTFDSVGAVLDVPARLLSRKLHSQYKELIEMQWLVYEHSSVGHKIASVIVEPLLLGAGGMKFVDPLWQRALMDVAESRNVPVIFDEVASGMYRLGVRSCREILAADPDIACYGKLLTGGLLPLSATLAKEEVFETFWGDDISQALLHGHSYTAHPVGCVSALHALNAYKTLDHISDLPLHYFDQAKVCALSKLPTVKQSMALGTVLSVTLQVSDNETGYGGRAKLTAPLLAQLKDHGIFSRSLGNVLYIMVTPLTTPETCRQLVAQLHSTLQSSRLDATK